MKVYCKIDLTVNFHHEHFIDPTDCPCVSEDASTQARLILATINSQQLAQ